MVSVCVTVCASIVCICAYIMDTYAYTIATDMHACAHTLCLHKYIPTHIQPAYTHIHATSPVKIAH